MSSLHSRMMVTAFSIPNSMDFMSTKQIKPPKPIQISIGYGWSEHGSGEDGLNEHWAFLRDTINRVVDSFMQESKKRPKPINVLKISKPVRLRAGHGTVLLNDILKRIDQSDILIFDISGHNANVLFELGYAAAKKGLIKSNPKIFIFEGKNSKTPSDILGVSRTKYEIHANFKKTKGLKYATLKGNGFRSAFRKALKEVAIKNRMWG